MRISNFVNLAIAMSTVLPPLLLTSYGSETVVDDPFKRKSRSKGEKARNRKYRQGR